jgi:hypothetical protein
MIKLNTAIVFLIVATFMAAAAAADVITICPPAKRLPEHERFVFEVKWLGVGVGRITASINGIKNINGRDAYELEAVVRTNGFCSAIYPINDRYVSYMDTENFCTLRHEVYRREGRYRKDAVTDFDQAARKAYFRNFLDGSKKTVDIPAGVQDALGAAYYFRLISVEISRPVEFSVYNNEKVYELFGVADRKKFIKISRLGTRPGFHIQPYARLEGRIVNKGSVSGYFSTDESRVPLIVRVRAPLFTEVTGYLAQEN